MFRYGCPNLGNCNRKARLSERNSFSFFVFSKIWIRQSSVPTEFHNALFWPTFELLCNITANYFGFVLFPEIIMSTIWAVVVVKWSACSPSIQTICVWILLKPVVLTVAFVFKLNKNKEKEAGVGPFKKYVRFYWVSLCISMYATILPSKFYRFSIIVFTIIIIIIMIFVMVWGDQSWLESPYWNLIIANAI